MNNQRTLMNEDKPVKVLLIEDNPGDARLLQEMLADASSHTFDLECADRLSTGLERLAAGGIDAVLLDLSLPDSQGLDTFTRVHAQAPDVPIMVLSGLDDEALAIKAVREGAQDYLVKGRGDRDLLVRAIRYAIERMRLEEQFKASLKEKELLLKELQEHRQNLEQLAQERTANLERRAVQLQVAAEIARDATTARDLDDLLNQAVNLVRDRFGFYHAGIFLVDEQGKYAILKAATGEAGRAMLERGHKLKVGEVGIVGYVTGTGQPRIALDVGVDAVHFRNPFLPETRSELALPFKVEDRVIGALDVQSRRAAAFDEDDVRVLQTMADQLAVAIEKARLLHETQQKAQELTQAARLKDEFLTSVSHELRTPLNAILGQSEALREQVYGLLNEKQLDSLQSIEESGQHLLSLINDILDVAKIEAGKFKLEIGPVSVESVCRASLRLIQRQAYQKQIKVNSTFDSAVTMLQTDERRLKQILLNLLSNAVKFTPSGGAIGLNVVGDVEQEAVRFTVWDTGIGIAQEDMGRLFDPCVQLDSGLSRQYTGTGLGLALVYRMVELHGGSVSVESEVGKGSRFTVSLPWHRPPEVVHPIGEAEMAEAGVPGLPAIHRALIIEDSPVAADQLTRYLGELGAEAVIHLRGDGAVDKAVEVQPDVIILDIRLPNLSGWDVLTQLKAEPRTRDIPVLIASVLDYRSWGLARGAAEYLVKPISRQQLQWALSQILPGETEKRPSSVVMPDGVLKADRPLVLMAEDNEDNINTILDYLLVKRYRGVVARNGFEAVERAREEKPDVILMDIQMPGLDGLEAIRRIRADSELVTIPIIAMTALAMPGDYERCLQAGADGYMSKPISLKGLIKAIEAQLSRDRTGI
jgi:signal transduction histidine kinase/DNA-binding response OmpR family regulator